jgi:hypothetical protein
MTSSDVDEKFRTLAKVVLNEQATEDLLDIARSIENVHDMSLVAACWSGGPELAAEPTHRGPAQCRARGGG